MPDIKHFLSQIDKRSALLSPRLTNIVSLVTATEADQSEDKHAEQVAGTFGGDWLDNTKPYAFSNGIAIIPVTGVLLNRYPYSWGGATGYGTIRSMLAVALEDPDVKGIVFDVNSPGGMVQGCFELCDFIFDSRGTKPMMAVVDANATSAAYAVASSADKIIATRSADVGSIGVVMMHVSLAGALEQIGIEVTYVYAGSHKVDGNPYQALSDEVKADFQASVDATYEEFVALVSRNRGLNVETIRGTQAAIYSAAEAKDLDLIDEVASPSDALLMFVDGLTGSTSDLGDVEMATEKQPGAEAGTQVPDTTAISSTAKTEERARMAAILALPEAKDRQALAQKLALTTDLSAEQCKGILSAAAVETPVAAAGAAEKTPFEKAMETGNPNIQAQTGGDDDKGDKPVTAAAILADYQAATGFKPRAN